ncbi:MAG: SDR family oxidoreductase [Sandaracinaceae bacterium]|nr:SDR family oxidoreductase [Sandaracinaceae bacterium]
MTIREAYEGRHLLVTGFTGFLGKVWVAFLLERVPDVGKITLLVRPRRGETAAARVRAIFERSPALRPLRERHGARLLELVRDKIEVLEGDARDPLFGVEPAVLAQLAPQIDAVVHCAGITDFSPDPIQALDVNVLGALHAADVAARTPDKRLIHVSTCFVAGETDGAVAETLTEGVSPNGTRFDVDAEMLAVRSACAAIDEREGGGKRSAARRGRVELGTKRAQALGWPNLYTFSKGLAEHALARREDVRLTLIRPSIVECARSFPFPGWNEGLNTSGPIVWMCRGYAWKVPMRADNTFDVVPVDTVARGMTLAVGDALADRAAPIWQLASGDDNRFTFDRALDLTALKVRRGYTPSGVNALERALLTHLDSTALEQGADQSVLLPAAAKATRWLRDTLRRFDGNKHLPESVPARDRERWHARAQETSLKLNKTSRLLESIEALWKSYQPFIHDHDYRFSTRAVRDRTAALDASERAALGWDLETLCWRTYWMDVEIPGLDKWSLPLLRGKDAPEDEPVDLGGDPPSVAAALLPRAAAHGSAEHAPSDLGGAE